MLLSPAEDSAQQRSVEALGGRQAPLHLPDGHLVLGVGAEQREAAWNRAEDLGGVGQSGEAQALLPQAQGREGRAVQLGWDGNCGGSRGDLGVRQSENGAVKRAVVTALPLC